MNQPQSQPRQWSPRPAAHRVQPAPAPEQPSESEQPTVDQQAGIVARQVLQQTRIENTAAHWKALKLAYLAGFDAAQQ